MPIQTMLTHEDTCVDLLKNLSLLNVSLMFFVIVLLFRLGFYYYHRQLTNSFHQEFAHLRKLIPRLLSEGQSYKYKLEMQKTYFFPMWINLMKGKKTERKEKKLRVGILAFFETQVNKRI
jgi:hypothetical protein